MDESDVYAEMKVIGYKEGRIDLTHFSDVLSFIECKCKSIDRKAWGESWIEKDKYCHEYVRLWWDRQRTGLRGRVCKEKSKINTF